MQNILSHIFGWECCFNFWMAILMLSSPKKRSAGQNRIFTAKLFHRGETVPPENSDLSLTIYISGGRLPWACNTLVQGRTWGPDSTHPPSLTPVISFFWLFQFFGGEIFSVSFFLGWGGYDGPGNMRTFILYIVYINILRCKINFWSFIFKLKVYCYCFCFQSCTADRFAFLPPGYADKTGSGKPLNPCYLKCLFAWNVLLPEMSYCL